ncbi:3-deoxy-D-manno-octulosonic acid transferase/GT30 [Candidatus Phaeomarinobacter ectocarpi]|uniref:3-deoxy-D-manno-octulosonic acid transferase n=1 Tax=Candidatus Phaeomarinibacter ectocarpi TaxID=1458461 RepID=X5MDR2_9HYPH|nr:3-deoxy-D-manno-octulosonic acid transferase [Candidatus Phaeomarinobacter ectocarpi]CDO60402.1 3-deoxy-D-manno-octulosonic acid transferase/GT30 [Candidatus Phaeomarinobacter ectocarpi]
MSGLAIYRGLTRLLGPLIPAYLQRRMKRGKEDPVRMGERLGTAGLKRPAGHLVWLHAASVGESLSILTLIDRILAARPDLTLLVTSGTVTSAKLLGKRLPERALHQFVPVDTPGAVAGFLDHWRPDAAVLVESELWPNLITLTRARRIPMALINARMSASSERGWRWWASAARSITGSFGLVLAQDETAAARLRRLGATGAKAVGNLKVDAAPPPAPDGLMGDLTRFLAGRAAWVAASTHPGEERILADTHQLLKKAIPGLLTVIVPRHPERGPEIARMLRDMDLDVAQRSTGDRVTGRTDIYLADTLGELGGFFRVLTIVFMGGSLVRVGGHNPIEPALLGAAILTGPHVHNFEGIYRAFSDGKASETVTDAPSLAAAIGRLMSDGVLAGARVTAAAETAGSLTGALETTLTDLLPFLDTATGGTSNART